MTTLPRALLAVCLLALALAYSARAAVFEESVEATCSAGTKGDIANSTVTIVCGMPHEQVSDLMRLAVSGRPGDYTKLLGRLDAMIPAASRLRSEALARFFDRLGEANLPPEQLTDKLVEIAGRYQELLGRLDTTSSADPQVQRLKAAAAEALNAGDFARTEELLNQAKSHDLSAIEQMQADLDARKLSAAEAAAENGDLMMTQIRYADAARYYAEAVGLTPEKYAEQLSARLTAWALAAKDAGEYPTGLEAASRALALDEARFSVNDVRLASRLNNLAGLYQDIYHYAEAETLYQRAIAIGEKYLGPEHPDVANWLNNLGTLYRTLRRYNDAEILYRHAIDIGEKTLGPAHPSVAIRLNNLGELYLGAGRFAEAETPLKRAIEIDEKSFGHEHPILVKPLSNIGQLYWATYRYSAAEQIYIHAINIGQKALPAGHPSMMKVRSNYADLLDRLGRSEEAAELRAVKATAP